MWETETYLSDSQGPNHFCRMCQPLCTSEHIAGCANLSVPPSILQDVPTSLYLRAYCRMCQPLCTSEHIAGCANLSVPPSILQDVPTSVPPSILQMCQPLCTSEHICDVPSLNSKLIACQQTSLFLVLPTPGSHTIWFSPLLIRNVQAPGKFKIHKLISSTRRIWLCVQKPQCLVLKPWGFRSICFDNQTSHIAIYTIQVTSCNCNYSWNCR
jgi:hypothetical protein